MSYDKVSIDEYQRLQAENERLRERQGQCGHCGWSGAPYRIVCPTCFARVAALEEALRKYGDHDSGCDVTVRCLVTYDPNRPEPVCDCGFNAALAPTKEDDLD